jgi:DAACS family dicarboxylate/amino acid:cation (Na+ or H+) symporter
MSGPAGDARSEAPTRGASATLIVGAMIVGLAVGPHLGSLAAPLGELGKLVIQLIKAIATPLLFLSIVRAILTTEVEGRSALRMVAVATINVSVAIAIGLVASNLLRPGEHLALPTSPASSEAARAFAGKKVELLKTVTSYVPSNLVTPFQENVVLSVILVALLFGFALRRARREAAASGDAHPYALVEQGTTALLRATEVALGWILALIPFAVFALAAKTVAEHGYAPLRGLAFYVGVGLAGLAVHIAIAYQGWIALVARIPLATFWRAAREPVVVAMGTNSSLATLPVTLRALDKLGVSRESSALGACVGTNLNNDGIVLYEGMAVLFVAQASGIELSIGQQLLAALTCIVAAMGVAGVPEAGFVSLALVLGTVGLPVELLPLLLSVDWILARARSVTNALSDMVLSIAIDRLGRRADGPTPAAPSAP